MRTVRTLVVIGCLLAGSVHRAWGQERPDEADSFKLEQGLAERLVALYLTGDPEALLCTPAGKRLRGVDETVRADALTALEKMGSPAVQPVWSALDAIWKKEPRDYRSVRSLAILLGRFRQPLSSISGRSAKQKKTQDDVRRTLIAIAKFQSGMPTEDQINARQAAIEALGKIYAQKVAFLIIERPEIFRSPGNARTFAKRLRNQTQNLRASFVKNDNGLEQQMLIPPAPDRIAAMLLDARNLQRAFQEFNDRKLFIFMGELEPAGKEKSLQDRLDQALSELETNLRLAATGTETTRKEGWLKANRNAHDLCEEMETLFVYILPRWEEERNAFQEVLQTFDEILKDEACRQYPQQFVIRLTILEATRRIYAGGD